MREPTEDDVIELLRDPACPRGRGLRIAEDVVPAAVHSVGALARTGAGRVEAIADECIQRLGGQRQRIVDPCSWLPNLMRRATGNLPSPPEDLSV